jgi:hypothetical protein
MRIRAVLVFAIATQEVIAHRHLVLVHLVRKGTGSVSAQTLISANNKVRKRNVQIN